MNKDIFEGKWKQLQGQAKQWWGKLTDDDLKRVGGKFDEFVGAIQEKYGYTREHAEEEIDRLMAEHEAHQQEVAAPAKQIRWSYPCKSPGPVGTGHRESCGIWTMRDPEYLV